MNNLDLRSTIVLFAGILLLSAAGVAVFRRWSLRRKLLDVPNDRSSHSDPTPRGGGVVIVLVSLAGYAFACIWLKLDFSPGYFVAASLVAFVSWLDDLYSLPFWSRLLIHIAASVILITDLGYWSELFIPVVTITIPFGDWLGPVVTVLWVVWLLNAYNFMDGIDGIAALQAVIAGSAWAVLAIFYGQNGLFTFAGIMTCSCLGFLIHNWQPARIFMGDVGSAFLGFTLAAMPLIARQQPNIESRILPLVSVLFVWFFVFDTLVTVFRRAFKRQKIWEAHREHIYQKMVIRGAQHASVTLVYGGLAALLASSVILALAFSGMFQVLVLFSWLIPTVILGYVGLRRAMSVRN